MARKNANADNGTQPTNTNTTDTNSQPLPQAEAQPQANAEAQPTAQADTDTDTDTTEAEATDTPTLVLFKDADTLQAEAEADTPKSQYLYWYTMSATNGTTVHFSKAVWQLLKDNGLTLVRVDNNGKRVAQVYINSQQQPTNFTNVNTIFKDNADIFTNDTARREAIAQAKADL